MLTNNEKYGIVAGTSAVVGILSFFILRKKYDVKFSLSISVAATVLLLLIGVLLIRNNSEYFSNVKSTGPNGSCAQTINIYQNCSGDEPSPAPPTPSGNFSPEEVKKWMLSVNSSLTAECQECVGQTIMKLWNAETLNAIIAKPKDEQVKVLNAILAFNCEKQCIIPANNLNETEVEKWVTSVMPNISSDCKKCAVTSIVKLWTSTNMITAVNLPHDDQVNIILAMLAANCPKCESVNSVTKESVSKWLNSLLTGAKPDCYDCIENKILLMWDATQFNKVLAMTKKSQLQVLQALIALNCEKNCIEVPSGLVKSEVMEWLLTVMPSASAECVECLGNSIVKMWTPSVLEDIKKKTDIEINQILNALLVFNCEKQCFSSGFLASQISMQVQKLFPTLSAGCLKCITDKAIEMWDKDAFMEFLQKPTQDQAKIVKLIGDYNCAGTCVMPIIENCNYMP